MPKRIINSDNENKDSPDAIEADVIKLLDEEKSLATTEAALMEIPEFAQFIQAQKDFKSKSELVWEAVFNEMEANKIKSIKGEWGSITVGERLGFDIDMDELQPKFIKKVADTTKIAATFKLEGKAPKGTTPKYTRYLTKRLK